MELRFLHPVIEHPAAGHWASVYADVSHTTEDAARQRELAARAIGDSLREQGADQATCEAVYEALAAAQPPGEPGYRAGRALFACEGEIVLDVPLAGPPRTPLTEWSTLPRLAPLLDDVGEPSCLIAYVDRMGADVEFRDTHGRTHQLGSVRGQDWPIHRTARDEWDERKFQNSVQNTWEGNAALVAEELAAHWQQCDADLLLLVGEARERRAVHERLPEPVRRATAESGRGGRAAGSDSPLLESDLAEVRATAETEHTAEVLDRYHAQRGGANDRGATAEGVPAVIEAGREHRIDTLLVWPEGSDTDREVWIGPEADQIAVRAADLRQLGTHDPEAARADDALLRCAVATGAEVVRVQDGTEGPVGGLGALLRWGAPATDR
jgi:hypothetical protein